MDLKTIIGCLIALIGYSKALLELNKFMAKRLARNESRQAAHFDAENPSIDNPDELFINGDRRKFRESIARLELQGEFRAKELERMRLCVEDIDRRLQAKGI